MNLSSNCKISTAVTPTAGAAGTSDIEGTALDMQGFRGVLVVIRFGAITTGAVTSIKMQMDDNSSFTSASDMTGSAQTVADDDDDETFFIDIYEPVERYVRVYVDRGTQNAVVASANYIQYDPMEGAVASHGTGVSGELHISPAAGTA